MKNNYPRVIENGHGEKLIFKQLLPGPGGDKLIVESFVQPGAGPLMHVHWLQDECIEVVSGTIGYQVLGEEPKYGGPGSSVLFQRGVAHRFWNAGDDILHCVGWVNPVHTLEFYLSAIFDSQTKGKDGRPQLFDAAYLLTRYAREYDLPEIPVFVKKVIMPVICLAGKLTGRYKKYANAPAPVLA